MSDKTTMPPKDETSEGIINASRVRLSRETLSGLAQAINPVVDLSLQAGDSTAKD